MNNNVTMDVEGQHQLLLATRRGDLALVKILVDQGVNPNAQNGVGCTPLMLAAKYCWWKVAQFLLSLHDINLEARCETGWTALVFAAGNGHLKLVKLFLNRGAESAVVDKSGRTVLDLVACVVIRLGSRGKREKRDRTREVLRDLVLEVGLPVTDKVRREAAGDAGSLAICEQGRAEVRSLKKLARRAVWMLPREVRVREELPVTVQQFVNS